MHSNNVSGSAPPPSGSAPPPSAGEPDPGRSLVIRMTEYAFRVLSIDMSDWFEENMHSFMNPDALPEGEHTLEQYSVYQRYTVELERHFDSFAAAEGFSNSQACFAFIEKAIGDDVLQQKYSMHPLEAKNLASFLKPMLTMDPAERISALRVRAYMRANGAGVGHERVP